MNEIAAKLGEVGLPAPVSELAARDWDAIVVGGVDVGTEVRLLTGGGSNLPIDLFLVTP